MAPPLLPAAPVCVVRASLAAY